MEFLEWIQDNLKVWHGIVVALLGLFVSVPKLVKKVGPIVAHVKAILGSAHEVETINNKLDSIIEELRPNSGKSIRDAVNHIEKQVTLNQSIVENWLYYDDQAFARADADGTLVWMNKGFERLMGISAEDAAGWGWAQAVHPDHLSRVTEEWTAIVAHPRSWRMEIPYLHPDGKILWVIAHGKPLYSKAGELTAWVCSAHCKEPCPG